MWVVALLLSLFSANAKVISITDYDAVAGEGVQASVAKTNGLAVHAALRNARPGDVVLVPGGIGTRTAADNPVLTEWLGKVAPRCEWITSVCTGSLLLQRAGRLDDSDDRDRFFQEAKSAARLEHQPSH